MKLSAICTLGATRTGSALLGQLSQPPLQVIEAALDVVQLREELECDLPADAAPDAGLSVAIERRSCSTSRGLSTRAVYSSGCSRARVSDRLGLGAKFLVAGHPTVGHMGVQVAPSRQRSS